MTLSIRHLESSDTNDIFEIYSFKSVTENTSQLPYLNSEKVESIFGNSNDYTLVAVLNEKVVGHITIFLNSKIRDRHVGSIAIAIHPEKHGQGIGKTLLKEAIEQADNWLNLVRLELEVHSDNKVAITLYGKMGFETEGVKRLSTFKAGKYVNMLLMSRIKT